ncbi:Galactose oxidase/kelch repeat superfamily protein [Raphanus sativus]|nr:Galactose oxidase/kelch repeat superfamily protein [Raphanus sativus]
MSKKYTPPQPSLSSLPDDIVMRCLVRVPRSYHLIISWVSKDLRSLVRSPEFNVLRSTLPKSSLHVCFEQNDDDDNSSFHWFTLNESLTTKEYGLVPNPTPFPPHKYGSSTVAVGSKIFFIGGSIEPSSDLWILDTRSGNITQGPSMSVPQRQRNAAVEVIDGKIYVLGGRPHIDGRFHEVEVFHPKSETWELAGMEDVLKISDCSASVEEKVYMVDYKKTSVYDPREGEGERLVQMVSQRPTEGGSKDKLKDMAHRVCVVEDVLFAFFNNTGLMWFDTKLNVWRRLVGRDGKELVITLYAGAMAEYEGRLVVFYMGGEDILYIPVTQSVRCMFVSLDRAGGKICGTIDWSGIVATVPFLFRFLHCLAVSD